jgi:5-methylcytosine-specific restriction endonuclease McrA
MLTLARPTLAPARVLADCISGCSDPVLAGRLNAIEAMLVAAASTYDLHARSQSLHMLPRLTSIGAVSRKELEDLYTHQMSGTNGAARAYYNAIRNAPVNGKCPLCGVGTVAVLDHHLPKSKYPDLAVCPFNLVPACDFCNNAKRARFPRKVGEQTIHPYYDDFTKDQWVYAHLDTNGPPTLTFRVNPPTQWTDVDKERALRHFGVLKLGVTFASNANDDMITLKDHLRWIHTRKGANDVQAYLIDERNRYSVRLNSWQHAMYQTLSGNAWFINGGFLQIRN